MVSPYHPGLLRPDKTLALGSCDSRLRTIFISADVPEYKFKKVLCHEIVHAAMFSY
jgi:hypothetical protein